MQMRVDFEVSTNVGANAIFRANGSVLTFPGFLAAYEDVLEEGAPEADDESKRLPPMAIGDIVGVKQYSYEGHETKPPARYTEPSLVKKLEELGIGRPSTFASIILIFKASCSRFIGYSKMFKFKLPLSKVSPSPNIILFSPT